MISSILDGSFKFRPDYASGVEVGQLVVLGVLLTLALPVLAPAWSILLSLLAIAAAGAVNFYFYSAHDLVFNVSSMLVLALALFILNVAWGYFFEVRRGRALVSRFGEYVAPELVAEMAENPEKYNMDGESRELSVMFVDVRGFTTISEGLTPKALREYINLYLTAMSTDIRDSHRGTLDKYIGDAVMAFWGAPVAFPDHASRAVATALLMQASAQRLNQDFLQRGWPELKIGIGVNTGQMHVATWGRRSGVPIPSWAMRSTWVRAWRASPRCTAWALPWARPRAPKRPNSPTASWTWCGSRARTSRSPSLSRWRARRNWARRRARNWRAGMRRWHWCAASSGRGAGCAGGPAGGLAARPVPALSGAHRLLPCASAGRGLGWRNDL